MSSVNRPTPAPGCLSAVLAVSLLIMACSEEPLGADLTDTSLHLDTISVASLSATSYQVPPEMGTLKRLYLGRQDGFQNQNLLIRIGPLDGTSGLELSDLADTSVSVDSAFFTLVCSLDSIPTNLPFQLGYFPQGGDSIFSESGSNYQNFNHLSSLTIISDTTFIEDPPDTAAEAQISNPYLKFPLPLAVLEEITDSLHNRVFSVTYGVDPLLDIVIDQVIPFYSREAESSPPSQRPRLTVHYNDSLALAFASGGDLTITVPAPLSAADTLSLAIGRAMGLQSLVAIAFDPGQLPTQAVIKTARLRLPTLEDPADFVVLGYPLEEEPPFPYQFHRLVTDYSYRSNYRLSAPLAEHYLELETGPYLQALIYGRLENHGLVLISDPQDNDPFQTVHFSRDSFPITLMVQYVAP